MAFVQIFSQHLILLILGGGGFTSSNPFSLTQKNIRDHGFRSLPDRIPLNEILMNTFFSQFLVPTLQRRWLWNGHDWRENL
jgi:hypothetical protein